jgi:hypothetical protein
MKATIRTLTVDGKNLTEAMFRQLPETFDIETAFSWFAQPDLTFSQDVKILGHVLYTQNYPRNARFTRTQFTDPIDKHLIYVAPGTVCRHETTLCRMPLGWHIMEALEHEALEYSNAGYDYMETWEALHRNVVWPMLSSPQLFLLDRPYTEWLVPEAVQSMADRWSLK